MVSRPSRVALLALVMALGAGPTAMAAEVNVYSYREAGLIGPILDEFKQDTGIKVNVISAGAGLEQRIKAEGTNSPADILLTVDIGRLVEAVNAGISQPIESAIVDKVIPPQYIAPDHRWVGISMRARVVYVSKERVKQDAFTYEELADPKWKGKICTRSGQHYYNNGLFSAFMTHHGAEATEAWLRGLKANLAHRPSGGDREQARDVAAGLCDIAIGNTYYWALMLNREPDKKAWAEATRVILPTFAGDGTHVNISGVVLTKYAPNKANALKLIEWLTSEHAQEAYANSTYEYPIRPGVPLNPTIASYGKLNPDPTPLAKIAANRKAVADLVDKIGFDN